MIVSLWKRRTYMCIVPSVPHDIAYQRIDWCVCVVFVCAGGRGGALANPAGRAPPHCDVLEAMGKDFRSRRGFVTVLYSRQMANERVDLNGLRSAKSMPKFSSYS